MRALVWLSVALLVCVVQHGLLAWHPLMPDLPLALAVWAMVDGEEDGVVLRAWSMGVVRDYVDPGSAWFHAAAYLLLALLVLSVRGLMFRRRATTWMLAAAVASLLVQGADVLVGGWGSLDGRSLAGIALFTALAAWPLGWLMEGVPQAVNPVGRTVE
jgi:hypothetical protein